MHERSRTANLLGATALAVTDLSLAAAARGAGVSVSGAAALIVLSTAPDTTVTELGRRVGLSRVLAGVALLGDHPPPAAWPGISSSCRRRDRAAGDRLT